MFKISRKVIVIAAMVVLLLVTGLLNWKFLAGKKDAENPEVAQGEESTETGFFTTYKSERVVNREEEITYLDSVIASAGSDEQTVSEAQAMKLEIVANMELESTLEGLLVAKGFEDAVVTLSSSSVNVVVKDADLTEAEVAQILDVITTETEYTPAETKVIPAG